VIHILHPWQILLLAALVLVTLLLVWTKPTPDPQLRTTVPSRVLVAPLERRDLAPVEQVSGRLQPVRTAILRFELPGRVLTRLVEPGQAVQAGAVLLQLAAGDYQDQLTEAEAQLQLERKNIERDNHLLAYARRNRQLQQQELARLERLGKESLTSLSRRDEAQMQLAQLQAEEARLTAQVDSAEARLQLRIAARDRAQRNQERTELRAEFAGTINAVHLEVGDYANINQAGVELVDISQMDLYAQVRGTVAQALTLDQDIKVLYQGQVHPGRLVALQTDPNPATATHAVRIRVPATGLRLGASALAVLPLAPLQDVLTVPVTALLREEGRAFLFGIEEEHLRRIAVQLGPRVGDWQAIEAGVPIGTQVVIRDVAALSEGQLVTTSEAP
jgi:RND family efflux transporter MFP subunit